MHSVFWTAFSIVWDEQNGVGKPTKECESHVREVKYSEQDPEYRRTRETRWEDGGTTLQA